MKQIFERVFCAFFFLIFFHTTCFAREFDIEECNTDTLHFEMIKSSDGKDGHYYYLTGICGQISFNLRAYYWIEADAYQEVFTHSTFGKSYLFGWECANSPVLYENFCALTIPMDSTSVVHRKYRSPLARKILTGEQLAELDSQLEAVMQSRLAALPREKTMTIPKGSALKAVDPKTGRSSTDLGVSSGGFRVYSPVEGEQYTIAPPFTVHVPERVDIQYLINVCGDQIESTQCEQYEQLVTAASLQCNDKETSCRFEGGLDVPMTANRHYMLIVRPLPLHYDPIVIEFDFPGMSKSKEVRRKVKMKQ